jgi:glycosyltransferase involved in cell wall biosynthesis
LDSRRSLGYARNYGVKQAKGKYVVFCDADNIAKPDMLEKFVSVAERLDADCLTCGNDVFEKSVKNILHCYFPLGPCFTLGISKNVFGDANFLVKRSVFEKLQGFTDSAVNVGCEDWEFLYKLAWRGFSYEVIPENLYFYRATAGQMSQTTDGLKNMYRINLLGKNLGMGNLFLYMASLQKRIDALQALVTRQSVQSIRDKALIKKLGGKLLIQEIRFQGHGGVKLANAIKKIFSVLRIFESGKKNE